MLVETTPQTHEAAESKESDRVELAAKLVSPPQVMVPQQRMSNNQAFMAGNQQFNQQLRNSNQSNMTVMDGANLEDPAAAPVVSSLVGNGSGGGVYRASDAIQEGDVSTNAFDDFFEYA